jgi:hypothetical protein
LEETVYSNVYCLDGLFVYVPVRQLGDCVPHCCKRIQPEH